MQTSSKFKTFAMTVLAALILFGAGGFVLYKLKAAPASLLLAVPFSPQAPTNNWSRNEDCEETSITMANAFLSGDTIERLPAADAQQAINSLKSWEQAHLGYNANTGADATTKMAEGAFGLKVQQISNYSENNLKQALAAGHPVLLPINAQVLHNPNYANGGPLYHMIVVRGYKGDNFTVNDPGTDSGENNSYPFTTLKAAAANWNQVTKTMDPNSKIALVLSK